MRRPPVLGIIHFFTTITTQNMMIKWKSDFWTYTIRHRLTSRSTLQTMNGDLLRSSLKYVYYLTNVPKMISRASFCCSKKVRKLYFFSTKVAIMRSKLHLCAHLTAKDLTQPILVCADLAKSKIFLTSTSNWVRTLSYLAGVVKRLACKYWGAANPSHSSFSCNQRE